MSHYDVRGSKAGTSALAALRFSGHTTFRGEGSKGSKVFDPMTSLWLVAKVGTLHVGTFVRAFPCHFVLREKLASVFLSTPSTPGPGPHCVREKTLTTQQSFLNLYNVQRKQGSKGSKGFQLPPL